MMVKYGKIKLRFKINFKYEEMNPDEYVRAGINLFLKLLRLIKT